jgi:hypothetical protein
VHDPRFRCLPLAVAAIIGGIFPVDSVIGLQPATAGPVEAPLPVKRYAFRYRFRPNQLVYYDATQKSTVVIKKNGISDTTKNEKHERKHYRVVSVDADGSGLLELMIDRVNMSVQFGENDPVVFDSRSSQPPPRQFRAVKASIGRPQAKMRFARNGKLLKVTALNRAARVLGGQLRIAPATAANDPSHNFLVIFPKQQITVGESWSDRIVVQVRINRSLLRPVTLLRRYEFVSVKGHLATISLHTSVLTLVRDPKINMQLIQRTPSGTIVFDIDRGQIVSKTVTVNKRVVGALGDKSSMTVVSNLTEKLIAPTDTASAQKPSLN